ncbi:MAG: ADP-ribosyl-[dinitrogen reductase] hydrolase [Magnetococcales bacterium]|nr:ADP-ribosyl-[dinitrogen reductase] hydrolase [Magnetococcales bacterium]
MRDSLEKRAVGAYLGLAVGDALGATVEFMLPSEIQAKHGVHNQICGGGWLCLKAGEVTDDTTMSLALGDSIICQKGSVKPEAVGKAFDDWMHAKPVDIGDTVRRGIINFRHRGITEVDYNEWDGGNGACMRTLPIALATYGLGDEKMVEASRIQAHITHHNKLSDAGTECINRMIQMCLDGTDHQALLTGPVNQLITQHPEFRFRRKRKIMNPSGYIVHTLRAVFEALFDTDNFADCLVNVVNRGGDADTTGAIAGAVAGAFYGMDSIPNIWLKRLNKSIRKQCTEQALTMIRLAKSHETTVNDYPTCFSRHPLTC